jgi:aminoglycoside 2''-phosphotransferase
MRTLEGYLDQIRRAAPDLVIQRAELQSDQGQFNIIVFVNDDLVVRFPRYAHVAATYSAQVALLRALAGRLPIATPHISLDSPEGAGWETRCFGYHRIDGEALSPEALGRMPDADQEAIAQQLATFLRALHRFSAADLPADLPVDDAAAAWSQLAQEMRALLFPYMRPDAQRWASAHLDDGLALLRANRAPPVLRHGDFGGGNILADMRTRRVCGVIDFEFAGLGDPATDVAALSAYGDDFSARCLRHYPEMAALLERAAFYRGTFALQEAYYGLRDGDEAAFASGIAAYR